MDKTRCTRRKFPKAASLGVTAIGILSCVLIPEASSRRQAFASAPNVILVMTDDQGYGDLACTGNPWIKTPNIDHFYQDAVRYTDFHVQPLCTPTRGALMTGHRPIRNGAWATCWGRSILRSRETTMADVFKQSGYATGLFGKWHLGDNYPYRPFDRGFDHCVAHKGGGVGHFPDFWGNNYFDDTYFQNGKQQDYIGYCTDIWFDEAMKFIDQQDPEQPFFIYIATNAPHTPYLVADKYAAQYRNNPEIPAPEFYGMITNIDENFGRLLAFLDERNLTDNTILVFMTDNGSSGGVRCDKNSFPIKGFNAGMRGMKGSYYEGGHRVPFFIRWPNGQLTGGKDIDEMVLDVDLLPTLIDLCGLEDPHVAFDGMSFAKTAVGDTMPDRTHFLNYQQGLMTPKQWHCCVMKKEWRLVGHDELYQIKNDPGQRNNVINDYPEIAEQLRKANDVWWEESKTHLQEACPISLGAAEENPTTLNAMDLMGDVIRMQSEIAEAKKSTGHWFVNVEEKGQYEVRLRRWPEELGLGINQVISDEQANDLIFWNWKNAKRLVKELHPNQAQLKIGESTYQQAIDANESSATFLITIEQTGTCDLEAWFLKDSAVITSAYYIDVERVCTDDQ